MGADPDILAKKAKTNQDRFGGHPMHNADCKQRLKDRFVENYGVDNPSKSAVVKQKMRETFIANYGVDNPSKSDEIVAVIKQKAVQRYAESRDEIIQKRRATCIATFGAFTNKHQHIPPESLRLMKDVEWVTDQHINQKKSLIEIAKELGVSPTPLSNLLHENNINIRRHSISSIQKEIFEYIKTLVGCNIIINDRSVLARQELDIYVPEYRVAIEVNGVYWHSEEKGKDKYYHVNKTKQCEDNGIRLIHIYDSEWGDPIKQQIIRSKLTHIFGKTPSKIFARQCIIKPVSADECNKFLIQNHIQGHCPSSIKLGLYYDFALYAIATFGPSRFNKNYQLELLRYATKTDTAIVGGLSKIIAHLKKKDDIKSIISYADRRWTTKLNNLYGAIGFEYSGESAPNYKYFKLDNCKLLSRNQFQKHMLKNKLEFFDECYTEYENMSLNGYHRIWDCGNLVYSWVHR